MPTTEYLQSVLEKTREYVPDWLWKEIHRAAFPASGGKARHRPEEEPTHLEKMALRDMRPDKLRDASDDEIQLAWLRLHQWYGAAKKRKEPVEDVVNAALFVMAEFDRRGFEYDPESELVQEARKLEGVKKEKSLEAKLATLPQELVVIPNFVCVVGSAAVGKENPGDIDVLLRAKRDGAEENFLVQSENVWLPLRKALDPDKRGLVHFIDNPQGAHATHIPVYDMVLRRKAKFEQQIVKAVTRETCKRCGRESPLGFTVPDDVWKKAVPPEWREKALCIACFDELATAAGVDWTKGPVEFWPVSGMAALADLWGRRGELKLDLGCGDAKPEGYVGLDKEPGPQVDRVCDLEQGIPYPDATADEIRAHHVLEHLADKERIMAEIWRVLKPGGRLVFEVPSTKGEGAWAHPDHKSGWNKSSFAFWTQDNLLEGRPKFEVESLEEIEDGDLVYVRGVLRKPEGGQRQVEKAGLEPYQKFTPPKPSMAGYTEAYTVDELAKWADGRYPVAVEPKHNGFRACAEKKGDRVRLWFEGQYGEDQLHKFPGLAEVLGNIGDDFIADCDLGMERGGKRVARPELMTFNAEKPELAEGDLPVLTVFDLPYWREDLHDRPFRERREELEKFFKQHLAGKPGFVLSPLKWVESAQGLKVAARWAFDHDRSEGLVAKTAGGSYELGGATDEWFKLKRTIELKVIVLDMQRTKAGDYNYWGGLAPSQGNEYTNLTELGGKQYINLGKTFSTNIEAAKGDVLTCQVLELIPDDKKLAWLGARVVDVDKTRKEPYTAAQAIDVAKRGQVLQKAAQKVVPSAGPKGAKVAFVGASPGPVESARGEPFVGPSGETLRDMYLAPLGLKREDVFLTNAVPVYLTDDTGKVREPNAEEIAEWREWLSRELDRARPQIVVALGQTAKAALGKRAQFVLPHPMAIRRFGDSGELGRKLKQIRQAMEKAAVEKASPAERAVEEAYVQSMKRFGEPPGRHTTRLIAEKDGKAVYRVNDGWGERYYLADGNEARPVAVKMPDVQAFHAEAPLDKLIDKAWVKEHGWADDVWDRALAKWLEEEGVEKGVPVGAPWMDDTVLDALSIYQKLMHGGESAAEAYKKLGKDYPWLNERSDRLEMFVLQALHDNIVLPDVNVGGMPMAEYAKLVQDGYSRVSDMVRGREIRLAKADDEEGDTRAEIAAKLYEEEWHNMYPKSGKGRFVYMMHWRGLSEEETKLSHEELLKTDHSVHGDLRLQLDDKTLWGFSVFEGDTEDIRKTKHGSRLLELPPDDSLQGAYKLLQPIQWLTIAHDKPYIAEPGGPGSTSGTYSKFFELDSGEYDFSFAREHGRELFMHGDKLKGRLLIQYAPMEKGRRVWLVNRPASQEPYTATHKLEDVLAELKQKGQRWLIWADKPGDRPQKLDVQRARVAKEYVIPILKADEERRIVLGIVLEPDTVDSQGDVIAADEIEKAAHKFLVKSRVVGDRHKGRAQAEVVESYVAPDEFELGGQRVKKGSWVLGVHVSDDALWQDIKRGEITGFSVGGMGTREEVRA